MFPHITWVNYFYNWESVVSEYIGHLVAIRWVHTSVGWINFSIAIKHILQKISTNGYALRNLNNLFVII